MGKESITVYFYPHNWQLNENQEVEFVKLSGIKRKARPQDIHSFSSLIDSWIKEIKINGTWTEKAQGIESQIASFANANFDRLMMKMDIKMVNCL